MQERDESGRSVSIRLTLVIDDHPLYCDALAATLTKFSDARRVHTVNTLQDGLKALAEGLTPDLVMLDLRLPDVTGLSGFFKLRDRLPDVPILVISAESDDDTILALMEAGAAGFIPKDASRAEIAAALDRVQDGLKYLPPGFSPQRGAGSGAVVNVGEISQRIADLTPQQSRIMTLICAGKPNKQIAYELSLAEATVKAHITALLRRLGVRNRTQAAVLVNSVGFDRAGSVSDSETRELLN